MAESMPALSLRAGGFGGLTNQLLAAFRGKPTEATCRNNPWREKGSEAYINSINRYASATDLGQLLLHYLFVRLLRHQMCHSVIYTDNAKNPNLNRDLENFRAIGEGKVILDLPIQGVAGELKWATACLKRLEDQCRAGGQLLRKGKKKT